MLLVLIMHFVVEENFFLVCRLLVCRNIKKLVNNCFKINGGEMIKMPGKVDMLDSKVMKTE